MLKKLCRKIFRKKFIFLILVLFFLFFITQYMTNYLVKFSKKSDKFRQKNSLKKKIHEDFYDFKNITKLGSDISILRSIDFNAYCDLKAEWINLNNEHFFKNGAAYYIIDESRVRLFFLTRVPFIIGLELKLLIKIEKRGELELTVQGNSGIPWFVDVYASCTYDAFFSLNDILFMKKNIDLIKNLDKIKVLFYIRDTIRNTITNKPMELKLKYLKREKKKSAILCAKCLYLNADEYLHLNWWIELNKRSGYEKIVMCNQSMEYDNSNKHSWGFSQIIKSYGEFVEISQLECIPNLSAAINETTKYFSTFKMMKINGEFNAFMTDTINILVLGQCYLDNIDKYNYIGVFDNDETVLPKISENFHSVKQSIELIKSFKVENSNHFSDKIFKDKCDSCNLQPQNLNKTANHIYSYLKHIEKNQNIDGTSLYFRQGYYISFQMISHIFDHVSNFFKFNEFNGTKIFINVIDDEDLKTEFLNNNCTITISDKDEYDYAMGLINIFNLIIKPLVNKNMNLFKTYADRYQRFFVILKNKDTLGKTIHNTKSTFEFTLHLPLVYLSNSQAFYSFIENENGYLNHFRKTLSAIETISVNDLYLDLNFLNCFFLPIVQSFENRTTK